MQKKTVSWTTIEAALDSYETRALRIRRLSYVGFVLFVVLGAIVYTQSQVWAIPFLLLALFARVFFSLWNLQQSPRCPECLSSLGWDARGSSRRSQQVRQDFACPKCGVPFVADS